MNLSYNDFKNLNKKNYKDIKIKYDKLNILIFYLKLFFNY